MDNFNNLVDVQPVDLRDLVEVKDLTPLPIPDQAMQNKAAIASLISDDPTKSVENYQTMLSEAQAGDTTTFNKTIKQAADSEHPQDMHSIMMILGDPKVSLEQKKAAIAAVNSSFAKDSSTILTTRGYSKPSAGEDVEQADVRITGAEQFAAIRKHNEAIQAIKTEHAQSLDPDTGKAVMDFLALIQPFAINKYGATTLAKSLEALQINMSRGKATVLPGEAMVAIRQALANMPMEKEVEATRAITNIIKNNSSLYFNSDNNFAEYLQMQDIFEQGGYGTGGRILDNVSGLLDMIGIGSTAKMVTRKLTSMFTRTPAATELNAIQRGFTNTVSDVSPIKIMQDSNPEQARKSVSLMVQAEDSQVAKALTGTDKDSAVSSLVMPQPAVADKSIEAKLVDPMREVKLLTPDEDILREASDVGGLWLTKKEKEAASAEIFHDFTNVDGITIHDNMAAVGVVGDKAIIKAVYGTSEGGFLSAQTAMDQVKYALREYGIIEKDIQLFKRVEGEYVPVTLQEAKGVDGSYVAQIESELTLSQKDITAFDPQTVKRNWFDRIPILRSSKSGTVANHLLDNASMLSPLYTGAGVVSADKATRLDKLFLNLHSRFSDQYAALNKGRQQKIYEHIKEANLLGLEKTDAELIADGFTKTEMQAIKDWRTAWDTHFFFENADLGKTLTNKGHMVLETSQGDKFFAKPIGNSGKVINAYDPSINQVRQLTVAETKELYDKGGMYGQLVRPTVINKVETEHIIVRNTPSEYLRRINSADQILNYRKGYYQVHYNAPKFIEDIVMSPSGKTELYRKVVAMAGSTEEAKQAVSRMAATQGRPIEHFNIRDDIQKLKVDTDAYWDLQSASGRIAQRHRGERLESVSGPTTMFDSKYVADPVESAVRASSSLSRRVATRDFIEMAKARALNQYKEFFPAGQWVENSNSLISRNSLVSSKIADARTTVEYINFLQHGYDNSLDAGFKYAMNGFANMAANSGLKNTEKMFLHLAGDAPTNFLKNGVFQSYLALNPLRQIIIQSHQAVRMLAYNPTYHLTGKSALDGMEYLSVKSGMVPLTAKSKPIFDFVENSGMLDAVDKQNLVRGSLSELANSTKPIRSAIGRAIAIPRKMGYDIGEQSQLLSHLLTVRDKFIKAGKNLADPAVRDEAYSTVRALSYDMNSAGDLPYNQNALGLFMQFFQVPHKAITSATTNRRIPVGDKLRLAAADLALFGVPGATIIYNVVPKEMLPSDPEVREATVFGMESVMLNTVISKIAGTETQVDFSALSPYSVDGFAHLLHAVVSGGSLEFIQNTPAFTLYLKEGSRMREAFGRMFRYFGVIDTQKGQEPENALSVLSGFVEMSSGWSNLLKARAIVEVGKLPTTKAGERMMENEKFVYAAAKLFGFSSMAEAQFYAVSKEITEGTKAHEAEVMSWYKSYIKVLTRNQKFTNEDPEYANTVLGAAKLMWKNDLTAMSIINKQLGRDLSDKQNGLIKRILDYGNIKGADEHAASLRMIPSLKKEDYNKALKMFEDAQSMANKEE